MPTLIYALRDPRNDLIRYVGKTVKTLRKRVADHLHEAIWRRSHNHRVRWLRVLIRAGLSPRVELLETIIDGGDWIAAEQKWIRCFRAAGYRLVNATDGGEGVIGRKQSKHTRDKIAKAIRGLKRSDETRAKVAAAARERTLSPATRQKLSRHFKGRSWGCHTRATKRLLSRQRRGRTFGPLTDAHKAKLRQRAIERGFGQLATGLRRSAATRRKIAAAKRGSLNPAAKLDDQQVRQIKLRLLAGESNAAIARTVGVHPTTISEIKTGKTWRRVHV